LSDDHSGLLVLGPAPIGSDVRSVLALDDHVLVIKLTPNRADCLSVVGIAREAAAITAAPLRIPTIAPVAPSIAERLKVHVEAADLCGRFSGRVIRGVNARAPTPEWMQQRLLRSGQRPISALVDISNYVMLEYGRPSHVFDLDKVHGPLHVRWGRPGEQVELLNGQTATVDSGVGVIADDRGVEALAGIMGGEATAVSLDTTNIYVEAAFWWPDSIRGRARRFNFTTDAGHRFERGVDYATTVEHIEHITRLIQEICGGAPAPIDDTFLAMPQRPPIQLRIERCRRVLGMPLTAEDIAATFTRLQLPFERSADSFKVTPPSYRFDLATEEDLIEEVARLYGYDRIPSQPPLAPSSMRVRSEERRSAHEIRKLLADLGYQELINYAFVDAQSEAELSEGSESIQVLNPIASQMSVMRSTLLGGLLGTLVYNLNRKAAGARLFEIGRVFHRDPAAVEGPLGVAGVTQPLMVAGLAYGSADDEQWSIRSRGVDFYDVKGDVERLFAPRRIRFERSTHRALHPGRGADIVLDGKRIGAIGELHPRLQQRYELPQPAVVFEIELEPLLRQGLPEVQALSKFQPLQRDIAIVVDERVPYADIEAAIDSRSREDRRLSALSDLRLFDVYRPRSAEATVEAGANALLNKDKSLAIRIVLQDTEKALSDTDADGAVAAVVEELTQRFGARLRQ
jgi:phenylalanyl-tRNA synthetase beta chain